MNQGKMLAVLFDGFSAVMYLAAFLFLMIKALYIRIAYILFVAFILELINFFSGALVRDSGISNSDQSIAESFQIVWRTNPTALIAVSIVFGEALLNGIISAYVTYRYDFVHPIVVAFLVLSCAVTMIAAYRLVRVRAEEMEVRMNQKDLLSTSNALIVANVLSTFTLLVLGVILAFILFQSISVIKDDRVYNARGTVYSINACNGCKMHIYCQQPAIIVNDSAPTVIYFHGYTGNHLDAMRILPAVSQYTKICTFDRSGYGYSDESRTTPRDSEHHASEAIELLDKAGITGRVILAGHSYAGCNIPVFFRMVYNTTSKLNISGIFLIDPMDPALVKNRGLDNTDQLTTDVKLQVYTEPLGFPRIALSQNLVRQAEIIDRMSPSVRDEIRALSTTSKFVTTIKMEKISWPRSAEQAVRAGGFESVPLIVVAASRGLNNQQMASLSSASELVLVDSDHYVPYNEGPATVTAQKLLEFTKRV